MNDTIRVSRGEATQVGLKWADGMPPEPAYLYASDVSLGIKVPHSAANIQCNVVVGERKDHETGVTYQRVCKKRAGHATVKGEKRHKAVDVRIIASTHATHRSRRFAPSGIPSGVNLNTTIPHDCANHLKDVEEVARGY